LETKIKKFEIFFIPFHTGTYIKNTVYIFVVFRIKRAGSSNYRGAYFCLRRKAASKKVKGKTTETVFVIPAKAGIQFLSLWTPAFAGVTLWVLAFRNRNN